VTVIYVDNYPDESSFLTGVGVFRSARKTRASILLTIYLVVSLSALVPLALSSPHIAHALTGECTGNCDIDGCSLEARRNHTCCCWQKKLRVMRNQTSPSCSAGQTTASPPHCTAEGEHPHDNGSSTPVYRCGDPCGKRSPLPFMLSPSQEITPPDIVNYTAHLTGGDLLLSSRCHPLFSRDREPPDPPPRLSC